MLESGKNQVNELYQNLGRLFYAVAMADHSVHMKEMEKLNEVVRNHWLDVDDIEDEYGTDSAFQIISVFDWLLEYQKESDETYEEFEAFYMDHKTLFTPKIKKLAMSTSRAIASAFYGSNKSELVLLGRLQLLFDK
ncbi:hypothetical protein K1F50_12315 [Muricauda oceani]|uniref:TerB family tellurite resistance protein n=1 Tax=Flagellimonas oceani TaxID=2698672 RepID=A0A6G7J0E8_9FLAO|nr:hypothetical protein [Allomuricauda oceani]MBW8243586.1 hypothetical protein [Allomuricauda oceani]QII44044.1 hypothetical protein GVT53_04940 [Allomuricauda oceani]